jgi:hypothetical protein
MQKPNRKLLSTSRKKHYTPEILQSNLSEGRMNFYNHAKPIKAGCVASKQHYPHARQQRFLERKKWLKFEMKGSHQNGTR